jgi:Domain of unknown function (DUF4091)
MKLKFYPSAPIFLIILLSIIVLLFQDTHWLKAMSQVSSNSLVTWVSPSLTRIGLTEASGSAKNAELFAARGEYESFQIIVRASQTNLSNVNVYVSDLTSSNGQVIPQSTISLYREHYVPVNHSSPGQKGSSNSPLPPGMYADALIPFANSKTGLDITGAELDAVPFNLKSGNNQPIWVDLFVPRNTQAGKYQGTYTVTSNEGEVSGEISLKVWNFELPLKPSLDSEFEAYNYKDKKSTQEILKHKLMPVVQLSKADQKYLIDNWGLKSLRLPFFSGADYNNRTMSPPPSIDDIKSVAEQYDSNLFLYSRFADEINGYPELNEPMKQWARNFHQAGVSTAIAMSPIPELYDNGFGNGRSAVDTWILTPSNYNENLVRVSEVIAKGDKTWFYTALTQDDYSPKWLIDFEPINYRIPHGFINQSLGITGVLYWRIDNWTGDTWKDEQVYSHQNEYFPGEGMLVYPGQKVGVEGIVPSIRLKWIRDGVEDYEYIQILKNLGRGSSALDISRKVGKDWKSWTKDINVLGSARQQLGEEIEKYY